MEKTIKLQTADFVLSTIYVLVVGIMIGLLIREEIDKGKPIEDTAPHNPEVNNIDDCDNGCEYATLIQYKQSHYPESENFKSICRAMCIVGKK